ncbi:amidohydrolase family protein [Parvularcula sp. IMCC14364]|uniref:amidohydrolase family protein n=1 Tax=Parvularcula sp. IMCC14364 TaxID=3067902 RepID=UPI00274216CD|nr:amidohydrolase family protein [Parvularcula sp. IMCC14364]
MIKTTAALSVLLLSSAAVVALAHPGGHGGPDEEFTYGATQDATGAGGADDDTDEASEEWDVSNPPVPTRSIPLDVTKGTWMNVDVSPDGRTIVFDMLGDIYTLPITGGTATNIASGIAYDAQARFSPDGSKISFTSDRAGGDNIWIMNPDGSDKRAVTDESFRLLNNATWHPDGTYIAAKKHFTTARSAGTGEIWLYHLGGGNGVQLVERPSEAYQKEIGEPVFSPDGDYIYYTRSTTSGNAFTYADDSNTELFAIDRYNMETGETERIISGEGGSVRAQPSPDGKYVAFVRRERTKSKLYIKDLKSGEERKVYDALDQDNQETWGVYGLYPTMDWMPDSQEIVFWAGGKIWHVDIKSGDAAEIPFRVQDTRDIVDPPRPQVDVAPDEFTTRIPRFATVSPDGNKVVFESLGKLYIKDLPNGTPRRLTRGSDTFEFFPAWSRDSRRIVYVSWDDQELGRVRTVSTSGGAAKVLTAEPGHYRRPVFSPDSKSVVFEKDGGGFLTSGDWSENQGIYRVPANGGTPILITDSGRAPHFGQQNDRVFITRSGDGKLSLVSMDLNGFDERLHASGDLVTGYEVSPDGGHLVFGENYQAFVMPMTVGPQDLSAGRNANALPVTKASGDGATYYHWSEDGKTLNWTLGPTLYSASLQELIPDTPAAKGDDAEKYEAPADGISLAITVDTAKPKGIVAVTGARLLTMTDEEGGIIENGTILIDGNRIDAIGPSTEIKVPAGATVIDASGKTITPGFIDAHAHGPQGSDGLIPQQNWHAMAHLAFGVTTIHDPSSTASLIFPSAEMQRAGIILAPRTYSTAEIVYGAKSPTRYAVINSYEDALEHVRRLKQQGAHSIKNYNQPRRDQRQQVVAAAIEEDIAVVAEGGSQYGMDIALVQDGNTTLEHNLPPAMLYEDVLSFYGQTDVGYTPTLTVTYGGLAADPYWRYVDDVWLHPILSKHVPPRLLQASSVRRTKAPEEDFVDQVSGHTSKLLADRGVKVSIGAHGQEEGLAAHWEMWTFVRGGMTPLEALRAATIVPAQALGFDGDLGSLEEGKLADLVIINDNPLTDIRNSDNIDSVMLNGRLYDAETLNERETGDFTREPYWWE